MGVEIFLMSDIIQILLLGVVGCRENGVVFWVGRSSSVVVPRLLTPTDPLLHRYPANLCQSPTDLRHPTDHVKGHQFVSG